MMNRNRDWKLAILGLRLKVLAVVILSILLVVLGCTLVVQPRLFARGDIFLHGALGVFVVFVVLDFAGRFCCLATPVAPVTRAVVSASMGCQIVSIGFLVAPFFIDQQLELAAQLVIGVFPAVVSQIAAAVLFMRFTRDVANLVQRPDLAVWPTRVLLMFGVAGSSLAAVAIVLVIFVGIILLCGAIYPVLAYPFAYAAENPLIVLVPGVVFTLLVIYFPFRQYGLLLSRLADAIDSFTKPADTPFA